MNRKLVLLVMIAACGKGKSGGGGAAAPSITKADADAANAAVPADLKSKVEFEVRTTDDGMKHHPTKYTLVAPKQWKKGFMPGFEPNDGDNLGFGTRMTVGINCDGDCVAKDWAKTADKVNFSQYTSGKVTGKVIKDEKGKNDRLLVFSNEPTVQENAGTATATVNGSAATTTVTVTSGSKGVTVIHAWWTDGDTRYYTCEAELNEAAAALAPAFEKACAKVSVEE